MRWSIILFCYEFRWKRCQVTSPRSIWRLMMSWFWIPGIRYATTFDKICQYHFYCFLGPKSLWLFLPPDLCLDRPRCQWDRENWIIQDWWANRIVRNKWQKILHFANVSLFSFQPKSMWIQTPLAAAVSPSPWLSRGRSHSLSPAGSSLGTPRCGTKIFWSTCKPPSRRLTRKSTKK